MKKRISLFLQYFLFWFLFFIVCKILFLIYHFHLTQQLSLADILRVFLYGSKMDLSMTGYLMLIPGLSFLLLGYLNGIFLARVLNIYMFVVLLVTSFLVVADLELYRFWGFRMDATPLMYLGNPKEVVGSANILVSILLIAFWIIFYIFSLKCYTKLIGNKIKALKSDYWPNSIVFIPITACLILPIRGSLGVAPMNVGFVYFHKTNVFANHAAINVVWNVVYAIANMNDLKPYHYFDRNQAEKIVADNYIDKGKTRFLLNTNRPNIVVIIMESFTAKIIEPLGGLKGVTPNFTALSHEGILFDNCYATGDRTDKGIISVLNGYPGHPKNAIINFPKKTEKLPYLNKDLSKEGYFSEFIYGMDIDFVNFRSYFMNAKYDKVITKADFKPSLATAKWGVHDQYVFNRLCEECNATPHRPFFMAFMSLSSHEPFQVPMKTVIPGNSDEQLFLNSAYYADSTLGDFIRKAKKSNWWNNTLIVVVADHGVMHPGHTTYNFPAKFHIPMLWLGGAVTKKDTIISTYFSQSDFALTLLHQLKLDNKNYKFSQDFMSDRAPAFSYYVFNQGVAMLNKDGKVVFDHNTGKAIIKEGDNSDSLLLKAKAQLQVISTDFWEK
jgi:phosphoglycerol transferase MdoB-like AlkP superfamily enzyme